MADGCAGRRAAGAAPTCAALWALWGGVAVAGCTAGSDGAPQAPRSPTLEGPGREDGGRGEAGMPAVAPEDAGPAGPAEETDTCAPAPQDEDAVVITPPDVDGARGGFADLPPFEVASRGSLCRRPLLIGHRGGRFEAPENTLPAFLQAMEAGGDGVEIDVRVTADGELVAFHDSRTQATTDDPEDRQVAEVTLAELKALDAGAWFHPDFAGTRVPTVDEVIDALPQDAILVFDVKTGSASGLVELIARRGVLERSIVASASVSRLERIRRALPDVALVLFPSALDSFADAERLQVRYVRVPVSEQHLECRHWEVIDAGFSPVVSSTYLTWNVGLVFVNNMAHGVARREDRRPPGCAP